MKTRSLESRDCLSSYRSSLRSAMSHIFSAPFFSTLRAKGPQGDGDPRWTLRHVLYVSLLMVLEGAPTWKERFGQARQKVVELFAGRPRPGRTYPGFVKARRRITRAQIRITKRPLCRYHRRIAGPFWHRQDWWAFAADGMRIQLPRTAKNEKAFGGATRDKSAPELSVTSLYHLGTGLPWAWRIGPGTASEPVQWRRMIGQLPRGSLLIADAGFTSFDLLWLLAQRHVEVLVRMGSKAARHWPRKKNDHPPGLPQMRQATPQEKHRATRTYEKTKRA